MEINDIKKVIEALLFVSDKPLLNREIKAVIKNDLPENIKVEDIMKELQQEYEQPTAGRLQQSRSILHG